MRRLTVSTVAVCIVFGALLASAQSPEDVYHAPDGNSREMISSIYLTPLSGAPFQATITLEWTQHLPDGTTTVVNHRLVVRDSKGRIYQERRSLVPPDGPQQPALLRIEISDPQKHTKYFCDSQLTECELRYYNAPVTEPVPPEGPIGNSGRYLSRASLGSKTIDGVETNGTRETITMDTGVIGNTAPVENTREFWYSPKLALNLEITRLDPLHGDQTLRVTDLKLSEPDPRLFRLPPNCKVTDLRR